MNATRISLAAALLVAAAGAQAQGYTLEGAVIDSRTGGNLGVVSERGDINSLFRAQKAMTYGILRSAGIPIEQLPPEVRARIERFATNNLEAFRAFSQGLDLKDQGKFVEAKEAFRRAAELDPSFALAAEQQRSMPDSNLGAGVQTRAVIAAAAATAVDRGKATIQVDTARAVAALAAGQSVVFIEAATNVDPKRLNEFSVNPPGAPGQTGNNLAAAISTAVPLSTGGTVDIAISQAWSGGSYTVDQGALVSLGNATTNLLAERKAATAVPGGSATLADGGKAYWGSWQSTPAASASVTVRGQAPITAPALGRVDYVLADATRQMPTASTAVFSPTGGSFKDASGTIAVNFATRGVELRNLSFGIGDLGFSGLNGTATYGSSSTAGTFAGNYSSGSCTRCTAFVAQSSSFGGSFAGRNADGLLFSTFLKTGETGFTSGVHLYTAPPVRP